MKSYYCNFCDKRLASPQSLWNHKQRCFGSRRDKAEPSTPSENSQIQDATSLSPEIVANIFQTPPRTKADIIGYGNYDKSNDDGDDDSDGGHGDDEVRDDKCYGRVKVKFLPETIQGLDNSFNKLFIEFARGGKHEHRNELVFLLDELLRQNAINKNEYQRLNNILAAFSNDIQDDNGDNDSDYDDDDGGVIGNTKHKGDHVRSISTVVDSTVDYITQYDKKELHDLLRTFKQKAANDEFADSTISKLEKLVNIFVKKDIHENESVMDKIEEEILKLNATSLPRSTLTRFRILLKDIERNRSHIREILCRLAESNGDEQSVLNRLQQEQLLSNEQRKSIDKILHDGNGKNLQQIANVIKDTKI